MMLPSRTRLLRLSYTPTKPVARDTGLLKLRQTRFSRCREDFQESYSYISLPWPSSRIRLVEILPGDDAQIHCRMHIVDLYSTPLLRVDEIPRTYEALSYTWHSQALTNTILCDGRLLRVTHSVYEALRSLRRSTISRILWIDAICINQADLRERSHQVGLMKQIYNRAALVISWLGKEDEHTATAYRFISKIFEEHASADVSLQASPDAIWSKHTMDAMKLPHFPSYEWEALARLFERAYFRRIWVVQELVVSSMAVVRCGSLTIRWEHVEYIARSLLATGWVGALKQVYGVNVTPNFVQTISNCRASFAEVKGDRGISLSLLLSATRRFQATDPRDKIIAVVGLAGYRTVGMPVSRILDYDRPVAQLYREVTGHLIQSQRSLTLLSSVEDFSYRRFHELPSWVPDYSVWQRHTVLGAPIRVSHLNFHAAGYNPFSARWTEGSELLAVDGFCQDKIEIVSEEALEHDAQATAIISQWLQLAESLIRNGALGINAFWQTLIGDQGRHIYPAPEQYGTHFENYLSHATARKAGYPRAPRSQESLVVSEKANPLLQQAALGYVAPYRKFFTTKKGTIGLGPRSMRPGDLVCILSGGRVPFIVRAEGSYFRLVGESYVYGLMEGQAVKDGIKFQEFVFH